MVSCRLADCEPLHGFAHEAAAFKRPTSSLDPPLARLKDSTLLGMLGDLLRKHHIGAEVEPVAYKGPSLNIL